MDSSSSSAKPGTPLGINHLVINVRDMDESHQFWTEVVGLEQVGEIKGRPGLKMQFYSGRTEAGLNHHDLALVERTEMPEPEENWSMASSSSAINHIAIAFPDQASWLSRITYLQDRGIDFKRRVNHGMTHSLYITDPNGYGVELLYELPREMWEADVDRALNFVEDLPTEGPEALVDPQSPVFSKV